MYRSWLLVPSLLAACFALSGCATGLGNGYGNSDPYYPGGPGGYGDRRGSERFLATVEGVDPRAGRLLLVAGDPRGYQRSRVEVYFDNNTALYYQGQRYPVTGLERGDEVEVEAVQSGGRLWATRIQVVRNVRDYGGGYRY
jgi:hypothetical protein